MDERNVGLLLVLAGVLLAIVGVLVAIGGFGWFGRLPGDLRFGGDHVTVYVPFVSMILLSIVLTVLVNLLGR